MSEMLPAGIRLIALDSIGSTNDEAKRLAASGAPDGTVVTAREQTRGRGRRGRGWTSPPGNLYLSLVLRPNVPATRLPELGFMAAVALTDTIAPLLPAPETLGHKWPNDVLLKGKKLAGILIETSLGADPSRADWAVIGLGINVRHHPSEADRPATSLAAEGIPITSEALLSPLLGRLMDLRQRWLTLGFAPLRAAWLARAAGLGETISLRGPMGAESGIFAGVDEAGALLLGRDGRVTRVPVAEVIGAAA